MALDLYPCDLLCVHRDAEGEPRERRVINRGFTTVSKGPVDYVDGDSTSFPFTSGFIVSLN